jgi:cell division protein FtsZ
MEEINEGNNVIFEAAGEEANVIFGCVRKEEMNDYVSYTVIATGFDSARKLFPVVKSKAEIRGKQESLEFRGGFNFLDTDNIDKEDLEVPTILRVNVNSPNASIGDSEEDNDEKELEENTFSIDASRYSWAKQKMENEEHDNQSKDDDDESSSFLRMIMD